MQPYKSHELLTTVRLEFVLECAANETHTVKKGAPMLVPSLTCTPPQALVTCVLLHHLESDPVWDCSETFRNASSEDKDCQAFLSFLWRLSCCSQSMETAKAYGQTLDILSCRLTDDVGPLGKFSPLLASLWWHGGRNHAHPHATHPLVRTQWVFEAHLSVALQEFIRILTTLAQEGRKEARKEQ